jgi:transcriptional regulator GlxA family with amidase domain
MAIGCCVCDHRSMQVAVLTFDGFNEIDSFVALHIVNRMQRSGLRAEICAPTSIIASMNGVKIEAQQPLELAAEADAVIVGSGRRTREMIEDEALMARIRLDPQRQLIGAQCSGALVLARLGLLRGGGAICTDNLTRPYAEAAGLRVLDQPFTCNENVATAGGCLSGHYLATWIIWRLAGKEAAEQALDYVVPVGEERQYIERALGVVGPFIRGNEV